jgi:ribose transport system substrate-binding protein
VTCAAGAEPAPVRIGVVLKGLENPFFVAMYEGARSEGARLGARLSVQVAPSIADAATQAARARTLVGSALDCTVVNPISPTNLVAPLRGVTKPIVNVDSAIDPASARRAGISIAVYIGTDNLAVGAVAARAMRSLLPRGGAVVLVGGIAGDTGSSQRLLGFARAARNTRLRVVGRVVGDFDRTKAQLAAARILRDRPGIDGFFAANDLMALGVADAIRSTRGAGTVRIIGVDGIPDALDAIRGGSLSATVAQYPYVMGQMAIEACVAAARGARLPKRVVAPLVLVTRANAARAAAIFPRPPQPYSDPLAQLVRP